MVPIQIITFSLGVALLNTLRRLADDKVKHNRVRVCAEIYSTWPCTVKPFITTYFHIDIYIFILIWYLHISYVPLKWDVQMMALACHPVSYMYILKVFADRGELRTYFSLHCTEF